MRRITIVTMALAVIAVLLAASAAQAQVPREWGWVHNNLNSTRYNIHRFIEDGDRASERIWAEGRYRQARSDARAYGSYNGYGSYYGNGGYYGSLMRGAYGPNYGPYLWGRRYPYGSPAYSWNNRYGHRGRSSRDNAGTWGALNLGAQVIGTVVSEVRADRRHNEEMAAIRESERNIAAINEERASQVMQPVAAPILLATVVNATGECLQVNGVVMDKAAKLTVRNPESMQIAAETGSSCVVQAEGIGEYILLTCRK
jgi:hypothetical protein